MSKEDKHMHDQLFEVSFQPIEKKQFKREPIETRSINDELEKNVSLYKQCMVMYPHLKESKIIENEVVIQLPDQLLAKYIVKSVDYLSEEWITLRSSFVKRGAHPHSLIINLDAINNDQIANMCAELNECIDHFIARAT